MQIERYTPSHLKHHTCPPGITDETQPEKQEVPGLQFSGESFAPYSDAIKDKCQGDDDRGDSAH